MLSFLALEPETREEKRKLLYKPADMAKMERAKLERLKELQMTAILKEIVSYAFFIWILTVLSYGNRDPSAYYLRQNLKDTFIREGASSHDFMAVCHYFCMSALCNIVFY